MKNKIQNILLLAMLLFAEIMSAQGPDPDNLPGDSNATDAPIDTNIFLLGLVALIFAHFILSKKMVLSSNN